jgi:hypothetical protein
MQSQSEQQQSRAKPLPSQYDGWITKQEYLALSRASGIEKGATDWHHLYQAMSAHDKHLVFVDFKQGGTQDAVDMLTLFSLVEACDVDCQLGGSGQAQTDQLSDSDQEWQTVEAAADGWQLVNFSFTSADVKFN